MGRVIRGARRVPADAVAAHGESASVRKAAAAEAARIIEAARVEAARLRADAVAEGRAEGIARAAGLLGEASRRKAEAAALSERELADLALAAARRIVGDCHRVDPDLAARRAAEAARRRFLGPVMVRAAQPLADAVRRALAESAEPGRSVTVEDDAALAAGTCILEGDGGEIRLDDREMLERVRGALVSDIEGE
jgi:flagellar biosynthesis/type III secretory pathway protein FliH